MAQPTTTRLDSIFERARREGRRLVLPYLTAGDPDLATTERLLGAVESGGAEIVELGIPFSDPIADGPVIAEAMHRALGRGVTPEAVFAMVRSMRSAGKPGSTLAIVAMASVSIVHRVGAEAFVRQAAGAGLAGLIVPDADLAATDALLAACDEAGLGCAFLIAPTSRPERIHQLVARSRGFVYLLARAGITGETSELPDLRVQAAAIRAIAPHLPIAAGFGIATPDQVRAAVSEADGAIVGSAIVRRIQEEVAAGRDPASAVESFVRSLVAAARGVTT